MAGVLAESKFPMGCLGFFPNVSREFEFDTSRGASRDALSAGQTPTFPITIPSAKVSLEFGSQGAIVGHGDFHPDDGKFQPHRHVATQSTATMLPVVADAGRFDERIPITSGKLLRFGFALG